MDHETHRVGQGNPLVETMEIRDVTMEIVDIPADRGELQLFQERTGAPKEVGPEWVRGSRRLLDKLLVPRDPRGIVLACGFVAAAALGISALVFGDPLGYAYLADRRDWLLLPSDQARADHALAVDQLRRGCRRPGRKHLRLDRLWPRPTACLRLARPRPSHLQRRRAHATGCRI